MFYFFMYFIQLTSHGLVKELKCAHVLCLSTPALRKSRRPIKWHECRHMEWQGWRTIHYHPRTPEKGSTN